MDANLVAKVGDFGLARDISAAGIYTVTSSKGVSFLRNYSAASVGRVKIIWFCQLS